MRKAIAIISILALMPLHADVFVSNALGQNLGPKDALTGTGYEGESVEGHTVIYLDGEVIRERTDNGNGYTITEDGYSETVVLDSSGRRISDRIDDGGVITERTYRYDGDTLASVAITDGEGLSRIVEYIYTPEGSLAGLSGDSASYFTPDYYVYYLSDGSVSSSLHSEQPENAFIPDPAVYTVDENGNWRGVSDENGIPVTRVYSPDGKLISVEQDGLAETYTYDENGELSEREEISETSRNVYRYSEGRLASEEQYIDGVIQKSRTYNDDGSIEEVRYSDGVKKNLILFDSDGLRIRRLENF